MLENTPQLLKMMVELTKLMLLILEKPIGCCLTKVVFIYTFCLPFCLSANKFNHLSYILVLNGLRSEVTRYDVNLCDLGNEKGKGVDETSIIPICRAVIRLSRRYFLGYFSRIYNNLLSH